MTNVGGDGPKKDEKLLQGEELGQVGTIDFADERRDTKLRLSGA
jgi:hypothetical protein